MTTPIKILVLQLARLGDIYQTWPVLSALRRTHPTAEIHLLTRTKFTGASPQAGLVDRHWVFATETFLRPLVDERPDIAASLAELDAFCASVRAENFTRIINLSFSPLSSYFLREVTTANTDWVRGYTRFDDGYLNIPDDGSAYFYAQVGVGRPNRLHVTDLFAFVAGVELTEMDWQHAAGSLRKNDLGAKFPELEESYLLVHVGASVAGKTLSWTKWLQVCKILQANWSGQIVLIGSKEEREIGERVAAVSGVRQPLNLVGKTDLAELESLIAGAKLLIGGDSGPMQIASLTDTAVLNISVGRVNFWETGPRSKGSRILSVAQEEDISAEEIVSEAGAILQGRATISPAIRVTGRTFPYIEMRPQEREFEWCLIRGLYMSEPFPAPPGPVFTQAAEQLDNINLLALEQLATLEKNPRNRTAADILDRVDDLMEQVHSMVPEVGPILRWFQTERVRIGPGEVNDVMRLTLVAHERFGQVIALYKKDGGFSSLDTNSGREERNDNLNLE